jgi:DNA-binding winged helix-turn-helix (wHTH) protein/TolB-like protein
MSANQQGDRGGKAIELAEEVDFSLGKLRVRPSAREVRSDDQVESLEPRVMQVLVALARRRGEVVSRDQLIELCWGGRVVSDDALNASIAKVRRLASDSTFTLETIPRIGYRLTAVPQPQERKPAPEVPPLAEIPSDKGPSIVPAPASPRRRWRWVVATVVLFVVASIGFGAWQLSIMNRPQVAVLSFDVFGADSQSAYLANAIPTAIASHLTALGFKVVSPSVSFQYRGERKAAAAEELAPRYIIDGSVRREGDHLYVATRIDWVAQPVSLWSQDFVVDVRESRESPEQIAAALVVVLNPVAARGPLQTPPEVIAAFMRIASHWRAGNDMQAYVGAQQLLRQVPTNANARSYYAISVAGVIDLLPESQRSAALRDAREAVAFVAKLVPTGLPMAAYPLIPPVEWARRESVLRTGMERPGTDIVGLRRLLAAQLGDSGRLSEALAMSEQVTSNNSYVSYHVTTHVSNLDTAGRTQEADAVFARAERLWPANVLVERLRFAAAIARGDSEAATALLHDPKIALVIDLPAQRHPHEAIVRALRTRAPADIAEVEGECAEPAQLGRHVGRFCLLALVQLGRLDAFFALAPAYFPEQRAATAEQRDALWLAQPRANSHVRVLFRKDMQAVRADERFIPIVERTGLLDYWRETGKWPDFCADEPTSVCGRMQQR